MSDNVELLYKCVSDTLNASEVRRNRTRILTLSEILATYPDLAATADTEGSMTYTTEVATDYLPIREMPGCSQGILILGRCLLSP